MLDKRAARPPRIGIVPVGTGGIEVHHTTTATLPCPLGSAHVDQLLLHGDGRLKRP